MATFTRPTIEVERCTGSRSPAVILAVEKVRLLFAKLWLPVMSSVLAGGIMVSALWPIENDVSLLVWFGALLVLSGVRIAQADRFHRVSSAKQGEHHWLVGFVTLTCMSGLIWSVGIILLFDPQQILHVVVLSIVIAGVASGAVITLSSVLSVALMFLVPLLITLPALFYLADGRTNLHISLLMLLFDCLMLASAVRLNRTIHDNLSLRIEMAVQKAQLKESEERYMSLFEHSPLGVLHFDAKGVITDCNDQLLDILGATREQLVGYSMLDDDADITVVRAVKDALEKGTGFYENTFYLAQGKQGTQLRAFFNAVHSEEGDGVGGGIAMIEDVTEKKRAEETIARLAYYDALTELPNRRLFIDRLDQLCDASKTPQTGLLVFLDMDRFKLINDTLGHAAGDELLVQVAQRMGQCLGDHGMAARLSGDEFVLLRLTDATDPDEIERRIDAVMAQLQKMLSGAYCLEGRWLEVTPSIGFTRFRTDLSSAADLLKEADIAMYQAKAAGRGQMKRYEPWMSDALEDSIASSACAHQPDNRHAGQRR